MKSFALVVLLSLAALAQAHAATYYPIGTIQQTEFDPLTADAVSDGSTTSWINVGGMKTLTWEWTLVNAAAQSLILTTTCQSCNSTTTTCAASQISDLSALTISSGAATVNVPSWVKAVTTTTYWSWSMAVNYHYIRCTTTSGGSPVPAVTLSAHARAMAQ